MSKILYSALIASLCGFCGCATQPPRPRGFELPAALSEVFRGGQLKGLETATDPSLGMPSQYDQVSHTCVSNPTYDLWGRYRGTEVRCF